MENICFIDTEVDPNSGIIKDFGAIKSDGSSFHSPSLNDFIQFLKGSRYLCGHNIINHELPYIQKSAKEFSFRSFQTIDTLFLSPLLFPVKPYHELVKDDKLQTEELNNPLNDSIKGRDLFFDEVTAFRGLDDIQKRIYFSLLHDKKEFSSFFAFLDFRENDKNAEKTIRNKFRTQICEHSNLREFIPKHPIELAYSLALINSKKPYSIVPSWVLKGFPAVQRVLFQLTNSPCMTGCSYCDEALDVHKGLKRFFGFDSFKTFGGEPLQEKAAKAAIDNKSLLAVFPTGGGKSIAFQVPALMAGDNSRGLTVVISPLQSLMKDQVDNLEKQDITEAVAISGLLDPIERAKALERIENGTASLLYISPESLRSRTIEHLLLGRNVVRFVIDEAHCFSSWGQDFRVDYLYIGDFIKALQEKKNLEEGIPVSCFTATAKPKVIQDILIYFKSKLDLDMKEYVSRESRKNLHYKVIGTSRETEKYHTLRSLIEEHRCPTIVYTSRTKTSEALAKKLSEDGCPAKSYHGKMDKKEKNEIQDGFKNGKVQIIGATSAFGMGVDKKDVGMVVHYEISDSLENYVQEAGRAGRNDDLSAHCIVLYDEEDLNKHFILLNQTKLNIKEIQQIWSAIKGLTQFRSRVSQSALEIARKAGWDDSVAEIETRVKTAVMALEEAGFLKRGQNSPRIFANSIQARTAQEAIEQMNNSGKFEEQQKENATRIIKSLISSRSLNRAGNEVAESRIDYISDTLGIEKAKVIESVNLLREADILADAKDLTAHIKTRETNTHSLNVLECFSKIERHLLQISRSQIQRLNTFQIWKFLFVNQSWKILFEAAAKRSSHQLSIRRRAENSITSI